MTEITTVSTRASSQKVSTVTITSNGNRK